MKFGLDVIQKIAVLAFLGGVVFSIPPLGLVGAGVWAGITIYELFFKKKK